MIKGLWAWLRNEPMRGATRQGERVRVAMTCEAGHPHFFKASVTPDGEHVGLDETVGPFCSECGKRLTNYTVLREDGQPVGFRSRLI